MRKKITDKLSDNNKISIEGQKLIRQAQKLFNKTNAKSIQTRYRYLHGEERFLNWLSENSNVKKIKNVKAKHIYGYTEFLKQNGRSSAHIKAELSSIRFFHELTESKEKLPENSRLNLEKINTKGGVNRSWTSKEVQEALCIAEKLNRRDVQIALKMCYAFGLRSNEATTLTTKQVENALRYNQLDLHRHTKGGKPRSISMKQKSKHYDMQVRALKFALENKMSDDKIIIKKGQLVHKAKASLRDWVTNHRNKFETGNRLHRNEAREIANKARDLKEKIDRPSARLTLHGLRHSFANNLYQDLIKEKIKEYKEKLSNSNKKINGSAAGNSGGREKARDRELNHEIEFEKEHETDKEVLKEIEREAREEVSKVLGHGRIRVTWVYIDGQWVQQIEYDED